MTSFDVANNIDTTQFTITGGLDRLQFAAGAGLSLAFDATNDRITFTNTGDTSATNELQNIILNKGLQRDASNNFGIQNCATDQIIKYNSLGQWVCAAVGGA